MQQQIGVWPGIRILVLLAAACIGAAAWGQERLAVQVVEPQPAETEQMRLSGVVTPARQIPLAFQVGGRLAERRVEIGQSVAAGDTLFLLDPRDLEQAVTAARAEVAAAEASLAVAEAESERDQELLSQNFISRQTFGRSELGVREARTRVDAASARLAQAENALSYATLRAPVAGVVVALAAEAGQVVGMGQPLLTLAEAGQPETEVLIPSSQPVPAQGQLLLADGSRVRVERTRQAGSADPVSRGWRAWYAPTGPVSGLRLGDLVELGFSTEDGPGQTPPRYRLPLSALDERGSGPGLWLVENDRVVWLPVSLQRLDRDGLIVRSAGLSATSRVVASGTHRLQQNLPVTVTTP